MKTTATLSRRCFMAGISGLAVSGCSARIVLPESPAVSVVSRSYGIMYGSIPGENFAIPEVDFDSIDRKYLRRLVDYETAEPTGTIVVDTAKYFLYLVREDSKAMRYGVGLGREGFAWSGRARVGWKQQWPKWTPPQEMIARQPGLVKYSAVNGGMPPGIDNPLGARALYIFQGKRDTLYRLHGTREDWSIGKAVSSGCVRLLNHDIIDLYGRVPVNSPVLVI